MILNTLCKKCLEEKTLVEEELALALQKIKQQNSLILELQSSNSECQKVRASEIEELNNKVDNLESKLLEAEAGLLQAQDLAKIDPLTKLLNRGTLDNDLANLEEVYERYQDNFSVVFIDLDHFKKINDTFGHAAGDLVLKEVADILKENSRKVDVVARYGGEEIVIILPKKDIKQATMFANKIRTTIQNHDFVFEGKEISVTASMGVSSRRLNNSLSETMASADSGVYKAKEAGRNQVVSNDVEAQSNESESKEGIRVKA